MIWLVIGGVVVVIALIVLFASRRRAPDGVASFQRQIDALSPEARRPVVDRVQRLEEPGPPSDEAKGPRGVPGEPHDLRGEGDVDGA